MKRANWGGITKFVCRRMSSTALFSIRKCYVAPTCDSGNRRKATASALRERQKRRHTRKVP
jgi:hypothetical protein